MNRPAALIATLTVLAGCGSALDQDRPTPLRQPASRPNVATGDLGRVERLPGLAPPPKPFIAPARFDPAGGPAHPSILLQEQAGPDQPVSLSTYARQPTHDVDDFDISPTLTGAAVRGRFGPPAGMAGIDDPWAVYRLTGGRELWLHFADGDGTLLAADVVRGREDGYSRDRLYPDR